MTHADRLESLRLSLQEAPPGPARDAAWAAYYDETGRLLQMAKARYPGVGDSRYGQALYAAMRLDGQSHALAEMLALQSPPMSNTDREFLEGKGGCYDQFHDNELLGAFYRQSAAEAGVDTTGKVYLSGLARRPGDPEAWVSGRGDVQRVLEARGWGADGAVKVKARGADAPPPKKKIADDIVAGQVERRLEAMPAPERKRADLEGIRHEVVARHGLNLKGGAA
jgi:hypothetical protein